MLASTKLQANLNPIPKTQAIAKQRKLKNGTAINGTSFHLSLLQKPWKTINTSTSQALSKVSHLLSSAVRKYLLQAISIKPEIVLSLPPLPRLNSKGSTSPIKPTFKLTKSPVAFTKVRLQKKSIFTQLRRSMIQLLSSRKTWQL